MEGNAKYESVELPLSFKQVTEIGDLDVTRTAFGCKVPSPVTSAAAGIDILLTVPPTTVVSSLYRMPSISMRILVVTSELMNNSKLGVLLSSI